MTDAAAHPVTGPTPGAEAVVAGPGAQRAPVGTDALGRPWPPFAHGSEAEMARILDFYGVRWDYEPRTFPILWNLDGEVVESFSPDFYLPELDLFLELTTLKQRLVRKKNRKLRRLRELYPDIRIKLFYARDFRAMMLKYGRLALVDSLSGALGQVMPDRQAGDAAGAIGAVTGPSATEPSTEGDATGASPVAAPRLDPTPPLPVASDVDAEGSSLVATPRRSRNASRSRRRRAAAAARAAAALPVARVDGPPRRRDDDRGDR